MRSSFDLALSAARSVRSPHAQTLFPHRRLSLDEYLAMEAASPVKHELDA
jgi:hypothetical protein